MNINTIYKALIGLFLLSCIVGVFITLIPGYHSPAHYSNNAIRVDSVSGIIASLFLLVLTKESVNHVY